MKFPFRSLGKDLIGFLDKKVHFKGICRIFYRDYSLPSLLFFEKKKKKKKENGCKYKVSFCGEWNWKRSFE